MDRLEDLFESLQPDKDGLVPKAEILETVPEALHDALNSLLGGKTAIDYETFSSACAALMEQQETEGGEQEVTEEEKLSELGRIIVEQAPKEKNQGESKGQDKQTIRAVFDQLDTNCDGVFTAEDLELAMPGSSREELEDIITQLRPAHPGRVTFEEFYAGFDVFVNKRGSISRRSSPSPSPSPRPSPLPSPRPSPRSSTRGIENSRGSTILMNRNGKFRVPRASIMQGKGGALLNPRPDSTRHSSVAYRGSVFERGSILGRGSNIRQGSIISQKRGSQTSATMLSDQSLAVVMDPAEEIREGVPGVFDRVVQQQEAKEMQTRSPDAQSTGSPSDTSPASEGKFRNRKSSLEQNKIIARNIFASMLRRGSRGRRSSSGNSLPTVAELERESEDPETIGLWSEENIHDDEREGRRLAEAQIKRATARDTTDGEDVQLAALRTKYENAMEHLEIVNRKYKMLGRLGRKLEFENGKLNDQLANATGELESRNNDIEELTEKLSEAKTIRRQLQERVEDLREQNLDLTKDHKATIESLEMEQSNNRRLKEEMGDYRKRLDFFETQKQSESRQSRMNKMAQSKFLQNAMKEKRNVQLLNGLIKEEREISQQLKLKITKMTSEADEKDKIIKSLEQRIAESKGQYGSSLSYDMRDNPRSRTPKRAKNRHRAASSSNPNENDSEAEWRRATVCLSGVKELTEEKELEKAAGETLQGISEPHLAPMDTLDEDEDNQEADIMNSPNEAAGQSTEKNVIESSATALEKEVLEAQAREAKFKADKEAMETTLQLLEAGKEAAIANLKEADQQILKLQEELKAQKEIIKNQQDRHQMELKTARQEGATEAIAHMEANCLRCLVGAKQSASSVVERNPNGGGERDRCCSLAEEVHKILQLETATETNAPSEAAQQDAEAKVKIKNEEGDSLGPLPQPGQPAPIPRARGVGSTASARSVPSDFLSHTAKQAKLPWPEVALDQGDMVQVKILATYINHILGSDKMLLSANLVPVDLHTVDLIHKISNGLILAALINSGAPDTIDTRALNRAHHHDQQYHPFLHLKAAGSSAFEEAAGENVEAKRNRAESSPGHTLSLALSLQAKTTLSEHSMLENLTLVVESCKAIGVQLGTLRTNHILHSYKYPQQILEFMWKILAAQAEMQITLKNFPALLAVAGAKPGAKEKDIDWKAAYESASNQNPQQLLEHWAGHHVHKIREVFKLPLPKIPSRNAKGISGARAYFPGISGTNECSPILLAGILCGAACAKATLDGQPEKIEKLKKWFGQVEKAEGGNKEQWYMLTSRLKLEGASKTSILLTSEIFGPKVTQTKDKTSSEKKKKSTMLGWWENARFAALAQILFEVAGIWVPEGESRTPEQGGTNDANVESKTKIDHASKWGGKRVALMQDDQGSSRLERAFRMWINSINAKGVYIHNLFADCRDGLVLLRVLDKIRPGSVLWRRVERRPINRFQKLENCNHVVETAKGPTFKFSLVSVAGNDLVIGNKKLTLAVVWQMMRFHLIDFLQRVFDKKFKDSGGTPRSGESISRRTSATSKTSAASGLFSSKSGKGRKKKRSKAVFEGGDAAIIEWANKTISKAIGRGAPPAIGGSNWSDSTSIRSFKDEHLATSHYLFALLWAIDPYPVDWKIVTAGKSDKERMLNARYAISVARKLGATIFLLPEDIIERNPKMIMTFVGAVLVLTT